MSLLTIHPEGSPAEAISTRDPEQIATLLGEVDVLFERWQADQHLNPESGQETVLAAYRASINRLTDRYEFQSSDVVSLSPDHPQKDQLRAKFLNEHTHAEFEVRFFVEGKGLFYLHPDKHVYVVLCEQGDLISVPAGMKHWFDMGEHPNFRCIRLFSNPDGWIAEYTGDNIADRFPTLETYLQHYA